MWGAASLRQDGDILRQFRKAVDPEVAATPSSLATFLGCADMGLSTVERQCFYLAIPGSIPWMPWHPLKHPMTDDK
jgi:hypothetical protein